MNRSFARRLLLTLTPALAAGAILAGLRFSGLTQTLDLLIYDLVDTQRTKESGRDAPITLVEIRESDIKSHGWPIDDGLFCQGFDQLQRAGVAAIGFDIYRDRGVGMEADCLRERFATHPELVSIFNVAEGIEAVPGTPPERQSYNDLILDADGVLRRDLVYVSGQDEATVSFPFRVLEVASGDRSLRQRLDDNRVNDAWISQNSGIYTHESEAAFGMQRMLTLREPGSFQAFSLSELLEGTIPDPALRSRIVLIGSTAGSLKDLFQVPQSRFQRGDAMFEVPGVEIHANRVADLIALNDAGAWRGWVMPGWGNLMLMLSFAGTGLLLGECIRQIRLSIVLLSGLTLTAGGGFLLLLSHQIWLGVSMPLAGLLTMGGASWLRRGAVSQRHTKEVQQLLGQATSPAVAEQLWDQRDTLISNGRFEGRQLPVTVLFSDTANFTSVSEGMGPSELMDWLNRGMAICVPAVTQRGGMVNKFTGDGMLAVFGVPLSKDPALDARAALDAAEEIRRGLTELNKDLAAEGSPAMRMRIGVHSGVVLAGSMGSAERLEYAVIGDTVNCASRLESLEKSRHDGVLRVLVSDQTLALLPQANRDGLDLDPWGPVQVKGRDEPLDVYELRMHTPPEAPPATD